MSAQPRQDASPPELDAEGNVRKRVCKACDRCRLKKSKCDGQIPCDRCQSDNNICVFGERKKPHDKTYPKGYVDQLEQQQEKLCNALRELWTRLERNECWTGPRLKRGRNGIILTHDILDRLGMLKLAPDDDNRFEEDTETLMKTMQEEDNSQLPSPMTANTEPSPTISQEMLDIPMNAMPTDMDMTLNQYSQIPPLHSSEDQMAGTDLFPNSGSLSLATPQNYQYMASDVYTGGVNAFLSNPSIYNDFGSIQPGEFDSNPCLPIYDGNVNFASPNEPS